MSKKISVPQTPEKYDKAQMDKIFRQIENVINTLLAPGSVSVGSLSSLADTQATGGGTPALGTNSPATVLTAPYTWIKLRTADGTVVFIPGWK